MPQDVKNPVESPVTDAKTRWENEYSQQLPDAIGRVNRSGIAVKPLYTPHDWTNERHDAELGYPGQSPHTRGIYATMHRGRTWTQRQLIGFGTPDDYNKRLKKILYSGATAASLIPCNSVYRGFDADAVDAVLLGTCGTIVNTIDDMDRCFADIKIESLSTALNDPTPFTLLAFFLGVAKRRGIPWTSITGTSNQSDYISHFVANHMFFRLGLSGARSLLVDHIAFAQEHVPNWNALSVVGQHMQQAGATPAEAMAFTLSTAIQYARDCIERGLNPERFLTRFTFFFDISISFFEEIAKLRAGRRIWESIVRDTFNAKNPKTWRLKFHAQTSGVDLTRQQALNNIARVTIQSMAGILGGLQSLHSDAYDEVLSVPSEEAARVAVNTQNILRDEAHLIDVIDPLGGSYYVESLTNDMEEKIRNLMKQIEDVGGMYKAVEQGLIQAMIGESAFAFQQRVESGEEVVVGVNAFELDDEDVADIPTQRPDKSKIDAYLSSLKTFKSSRSQAAVNNALSDLARATDTQDQNTFGQVVKAGLAGATHGEIVACLRQEMGDGQPLMVP